jgi:hypothetical protein
MADKQLRCRQDSSFEVGKLQGSVIVLQDYGVEALYRGKRVYFGAADDTGRDHVSVMDCSAHYPDTTNQVADRREISGIRTLVRRFGIWGAFGCVPVGLLRPLAHDPAALLALRNCIAYALRPHNL